MVESKLFLQIQSIKIMYPNEENMIVMPITKRIEIVIGIQVCLISWMKINFRENSGKKAFTANLRHQYRASQCGEHDCCANNRKNGDYFENPSLSHFMDEH